MTQPTPTPLDDAIELIAMAHPCRTQDGGGELWCGRRGDAPDARFDDWGLARAVAITLNAVVEGRLAAVPRVAWQPIETAPRDGSEILVYESYDGFFVASWDQKDQIWRCRVSGGALDNSYWHAPSHWMPIPEPPDPWSE
jgi:hypothetical protein